MNNTLEHLLEFELEIKEKIINKLISTPDILFYEEDFPDDETFYYFLMGDKVLHFIFNTDIKKITRDQGKEIIQTLDIKELHPSFLMRFIENKKTITIEEAKNCFFKRCKALKSDLSEQCLTTINTNYQNHLLKFTIPQTNQKNTVKI